MKYIPYAVHSWLICLAAIALPAHAQVYKWVDANGKTQYSDKAPENKKSGVSEVKIAPPPPQSAPVAPSDPNREHDFYHPKTPVNPQPEKPVVRQQPAPMDPCQRARSIVQGIKEKRLYRAPYGRMSSEKDRVYLDEHELELFENDVKQYCH